MDKQVKFDNSSVIRMAGNKYMILYKIQLF